MTPSVDEKVDSWGWLCWLLSRPCIGPRYAQVSLQKWISFQEYTQNAPFQDRYMDKYLYHMAIATKKYAKLYKTNVHAAINIHIYIYMYTYTYCMYIYI